jgi:AraC-like DNA-binding protein
LEKGVDVTETATGGPMAAEFVGAPAPTVGMFSTDALPVHQQFEAWRARVGPLVELSPVTDPRAGYVASNRLWSVAGMAYSQVTAPAVGFQRTAAAIRRDAIDHWMLLSVRRGSATFRLDDRIVTARPGAPVILPLGRPHTGRRTTSEWKPLFIPRDMLADVSAQFGTSAVTFDAPFGQVLDDFVLSLERALPAMTADHLARLPQMVSALLAATLGSRARLGQGAGDEAARQAVDIARRERVRSLIRANLGSYTLGPRALCRMTGLSRSALYRLFEECGGVATAIQRERLRVAHAALSDPSDLRSIRAIAEELAFGDASIFSRAFRAEFRCTPREVRRAALVGDPPVRRRADETAMDPADLVGLLRRL